MSKASLRLLAALTAGCCHVAGAETIGSWILETANDGSPFIVALNDSGSGFGKFCETSVTTCYWIMTTSTSCVKGSSVPILINYTTGVRAATATCYGDYTSGGTRYYKSMLSDPDALDAVVRSSENLSIAYATEGEYFKVLRFSISGGALALTKWSANVTKFLKTAKRDQVL